VTPTGQRFAAIAAALVLAWGVLFRDWPPYWILALFWIENVVIGLATLVKLVVAGRRTKAVPEAIATCAFFCVHYGLFCGVHGVFVAALFGAQKGAGVADQDEDLGGILLGMVSDVVRDVPGQLALASIVVAVGVDLVQWLAAHRDARDSQLIGETMGAPYARIVVLHLVILGGAFLMQLLNAPAAAVLLLVALKLLVDLGVLHFGRRKPTAGEPLPPDQRGA
jgi:hypothetical protein